MLSVSQAYFKDVSGNVDTSSLISLIDSEACKDFHSDKHIFEA